MVNQVILMRNIWKLNLPLNKIVNLYNLKITVRSLFDNFCLLDFSKRQKILSTSFLS